MSDSTLVDKKSEVIERFGKRWRVTVKVYEDGSWYSVHVVLSDWIPVLKGLLSLPGSESMYNRRSFLEEDEVSDVAEGLVRDMLESVERQREREQRTFDIDLSGV